MLETTFSSTGESVATHDDRRGLVEQRDRAVLHLAGRVGVGGDVGDLLELQRALERHRQADVAAEVEEEVALVQCARAIVVDLLLARFEQLLDAVRACA